MALQNPYGTRLKEEFPTFAFNEQEVFQFHPENHDGGWGRFFSERLGKEPKRLILEIGCSNAHFLTTIARANPDVGFVGLDWKYKVIYNGAKKVQRDELNNVALLRGRAQDLTKIFGAGELDEIWIFFPDPWAKKSQLKNRIMQEAPLLEMHKLLKPSGRIYFKTDHPGYYQWVLALFGEPEPELPDYNDATPEERSRRARQVKVRRLERDLLPETSDNLRQHFKLDLHSKDYWREEHPKTFFSETQTLFEKLFVEEDLPIYYVELSAKK